MGTTYFEPRAIGAGQSVFIAIASYSDVKAGFCYALVETVTELTRRGIPHQVAIESENCHVDDGRNSLVRRFLESGFTDLVFLDTDVMWKPDAFLRLLSWSEDVVAGAYPKKCYPPSYPIGRIFEVDETTGVLSVSFAPTGFMRIRRAAFERLLPSQSKSGPMAIFFERRFHNGSRDGGDVTFCRKWIESGGKVKVDPNLLLSHIGENRWTGRFLDHLANDENRAKHFDSRIDPKATAEAIVQGANGTVGILPGRAAPAVGDLDMPRLVAAVERLRAGDASPDTFVEMAEAWGNKPWAATAGFLLVMHGMAGSVMGPVLEAGSGLSTIVLAAVAARGKIFVTAMENDPEWARKTHAALEACGLDDFARIIVSPLDDEWYVGRSRIAQIYPAPIEMLVIDGPPRHPHPGRRKWPMRLLRDEAAVIADDVSLGDHPYQLFGYPGDWLQGGTKERPFVVGRYQRPRAAAVAEAAE